LRIKITHVVALFLSSRSTLLTICVHGGDTRSTVVWLLLLVLLLLLRLLLLLLLLLLL
jgi:hypothetical protein